MRIPNREQTPQKGSAQAMAEKHKACLQAPNVPSARHPCIMEQEVKHTPPKDPVKIHTELYTEQFISISKRSTTLTLI